MSRLNIEDIRLDGGTQMRAKLNEDVIAGYAEHYPEQGCEMPPVVVFYDGDVHWLADGFHRIHAAKKAGRKRIAADIRSGTRRDAILHAVGANATHGLPRSNADKRRAVTTLLNDEEWRAKSDRSIAKHCGVSHTLVDKMRAELATDATSGAYRIGTDGKAYPVRESEPAPPSGVFETEAGPLEVPSPEPTDDREQPPAGVSLDREDAEAVTSMLGDPPPPNAFLQEATELARDSRAGDFMKEAYASDEYVECARAAVEALSGSQLAVFAQRLTNEKRAALAALLTGEVPRSTTG